MPHRKWLAVGTSWKSKQRPQSNDHVSSLAPLLTNPYKIDDDVRQVDPLSPFTNSRGRDGPCRFPKLNYSTAEPRFPLLPGAVCVMSHDY